MVVSVKMFHAVFTMCNASRRLTAGLPLRSWWTSGSAVSCIGHWLPVWCLLQWVGCSTLTEVAGSRGFRLSAEPRPLHGWQRCRQEEWLSCWTSSSGGWNPSASHGVWQRSSRLFVEPVAHILVLVWVVGLAEASWPGHLSDDERLDLDTTGSAGCQCDGDSVIGPLHSLYAACGECRIWPKMLQEFCQGWVRLPGRMQ